MAGSVAIKFDLPFHYWAHANDFIYEPLVRDFACGAPTRSILSLVFHVGVPAAIVVGIARGFGWYKKRETNQSLDTTNEHAGP